MMLWVSLVFQAFVILLIIFLILRKRSTVRGDADEPDPVEEGKKPGVSLSLPEEEKWE